MRYLMCKPSFFDVAYVINPWMDSNVYAVAPQVAGLQWRNLYTLVSEHAEIELIEPQSNVPDMPFTANAGLVLEQMVVLSNFRHSERQPETEYFSDWFEIAGFDVRRLPEAIPFEGAGDALLDRRLPVIWMGHGHRTSIAALSHLNDGLNIEVLPLKLVDERFYRLDTCFCPLQGGELLYYPAAFDAKSQTLIRDYIPAERLIAVEEADALQFACNAINLGSLILMHHASPALRHQLAEHGFHTLQTDLSEFLKAGGSAKCLTLRLNEPRVQAPLPTPPTAWTAQRD